MQGILSALLISAFFQKYVHLFHRRVHVTQEVVDCLGGDYELEPGNGGDRNAFLRDYNIKTYLIKDMPFQKPVSTFCH